MNRLSTAGLAIPFLCAIVAQVAGPHERPVVGEVSRPGLSFRQHLVDLGEVPPGEEVRGWFEFINTGSTPVKITKITPSCGCLQPRLKKEVYQPGERGDITVRVKTALEAPGAKEYRVRVDFEDAQPRTMDLGFKLVLPENQVLVRPRALLCYQTNGQPTEKEISVTDGRSTPLTIEGATSSSDFVAVKIVGAGRDEDGRWCTTIKVTVAGEVPPGEHHTSVTMFSNDPAYPELRVPLIIAGRPVATAAGKANSPK
jgi:hypothetical protein